MNSFTEKNIKIPSNFKLFGHTYTVKFDANLYKKHSLYGLFDPSTKTLSIQSSGKVEIFQSVNDDEIEQKKIIQITDEDVVETFYHELTHTVLDAISEDELYVNEKFVTAFSKALLDVFTSANYNDEQKKTKRSNKKTS